MDFIDMVQKRQSIRAFLPKAIPSEAMEQILSVIISAPSAGNLQARAISVVTSPSHKRELAAAANQQMFLSDAAAVLVFNADPPRSAQRYHERGETLYSVQDATIACAFAMMAATALGVASVWVGAFDEEQVRKIVGGPAASRPVALLVLGYAAETPPRRSRRPLSEMVRFLDAGN